MTQCQRLLDYMERGNRVTQFEAISSLGILRLASRISDLRNQGHIIEREMVDVSNRYGEKCRVARYTLIKKAEVVLSEK